jgi:hypothetical protein
MEETCKPLFSFGVIADVQYGDKDDNREFFIPSHCIYLIRKIESNGGFHFFLVCHKFHVSEFVSFIIAYNFVVGAWELLHCMQLCWSSLGASSLHEICWDDL